MLLYHYTSLAGLLGISRSRSLYASAARYLNDSAEIKHFSKLLKAEAHLRKSSSASEKLIRLYNQFEVWIEQRMIGNWGLVPFVSCFSSNPDQLSQWRGYCPPGKGISIGFKISDLVASAQAQKFRFGPCLYDPAAQDQLAREALNDLEAHLGEYPEDSDPPKWHQSQSFHGLFEAVYPGLIQLACLMKDESFREESEWRVVSTPIGDFRNSEIKFRGKRSGPFRRGLIFFASSVRRGTVQGSRPVRPGWRG